MGLVTAGMTRRQVRRVLGRPTASINQREFEGQYQSVSRLGGGLWRRRRSEAWVYQGVPSQGMATWIMFERGRVTTVETSHSPNT
jgi:hypothetical protein